MAGQRVSVRRLLKAFAVLLAVPLLLALVVVVAFFWISRPLGEGDAAPVTAGVTPEGAPFDLAAVRAGRPAIVNIWGTWCGPCVDELPHLAAYAQAHPDIAVIGLSDDEPVVLQRFLKRTPIPYPLGLLRTSAFAEWHVAQWPTTYFLDVDGKVRAAVTTSMTPEQLQQTAAVALMKQP